MASPLVTRKRLHGFSKPDDQGKNKKDGHLRTKFHFLKTDNRTGITLHIPAPIPIGHKAGYSRAQSLNSKPVLGDGSVGTKCKVRRSELHGRVWRTSVVLLDVIRPAVLDVADHGEGETVFVKTVR
jgi:hypothetical protein